MPTRESPPPITTAAAPPFDRRARAVELAAIFTAGPALLALGPRWLVSVGILLSGIVCTVALALDRTFPRRALFDVAATRVALGSVARRTLVVWLGLAALTAVAAPRALLSFPRARPLAWVLVMALYPVSAYAQEVVFRTFFFHRYGGLFARPRLRVIASGVAFGWAHIVVNNFAAVGLATVAGVLFASTYERSRSTVLVSLEHALTGDFVFTIGLGGLFYSSARWVVAAGGH